MVKVKVSASQKKEGNWLEVWRNGLVGTEEELATSAHLYGISCHVNVYAITACVYTDRKAMDCV